MLFANFSSASKLRDNIFACNACIGNISFNATTIKSVLDCCLCDTHLAHSVSNAFPPLSLAVQNESLKIVTDFPTPTRYKFEYCIPKYNSNPLCQVVQLLSPLWEHFLPFLASKWKGNLSGFAHVLSLSDTLQKWIFLKLQKLGEVCERSSQRLGNKNKT